MTIIVVVAVATGLSCWALDVLTERFGAWRTLQAIFVLAYALTVVELAI